jgi:hypothetical protein
VRRRWYPDEFRDAVLFWAIVISTPLLLALFFYFIVR